jgi:hypothetical protein
MTLEQAKQFLLDHSNPVEMTQAQLEQYRQALQLVAVSWAVLR